MSELGGNPDALKNLEITSSVGEVSVAVGEREGNKPSMDSVVSISATGGKDAAQLMLSDIITKEEKDAANGDTSKIQEINQQKLAPIIEQALNNPRVKSADILKLLQELPQRVQEKLNTLGMSGLVMNVTGNNREGGRQASALATCIFLEHISSPHTKDTDPQKLIQDALQKTHKAVAAFNMKQGVEAACTMAVGLIGKNGEAVMFNGGYHEMTSVKDGAISEISESKPNVVDLGTLTRDKSKAANLPPLQLSTQKVDGQLIVGVRGTTDKLEKAGDLRDKKVGEVARSLAAAETKEGTPQITYESIGASNRGGRAGEIDIKDRVDQDAFFDGTFHFGEVGFDPVANETVPVTPEKTREAFANLLATNELITDKDGKVVSNPEEIKKRIADVEKVIKEAKEKGILGSLDIVCDGMGGEGSGEIASSIGTFALTNEVAQAIEANQPLDKALLAKAINKANESVKAFNQKTGNDSGSTLVVSLMAPDGKALVASVGDSRIYKRDKDGNIVQLTSDNSKVWRLMSAGQITPQELLNHPEKNVIYNSLNDMRSWSEDSIVESQLADGESLLLMCDGAWEGIDTSKDKALLDEIDKQFLHESATVGPEEAGKIAFGRIMKEINLAGVTSRKAAVDRLTSPMAGTLAHDNVSAVIVNRSETTPKTTTDGISVAAAEIKSESPKPGDEEEKKPSSPAVNPERNTEKHKPPYYIDEKETEDRKGIESKLIFTRTVRKKDGSLEKERVNFLDAAEDMYRKIEQDNILPDLSTDIPSRKKVQIYEQLAERIRHTGDYSDTEDAVFDIVRGNVDKHRLLMAVEEQMYRAMEEANAELRQFARDKAESGLKRRKMKDEVGDNTDLRDPEGDLLPYFIGKNSEGKLIRNEVPAVDLEAYSFIADQLLEVKHPDFGKTPDGKDRTYRQYLQNLRSKAQRSSFSQETSQDLDEAKRLFTKRTLEAMRTRTLDVSSRVPRSAEEQILREMRISLQTLAHLRESATNTNDAVEKLMQQFVNIQGKPKTEVQIQKMRNRLQSIVGRGGGEFFDGAVKAAEMMYRRSLYESEKIEYYQIPDVIYRKRKIEGVHDADFDNAGAAIRRLANIDEQEPARTNNPDGISAAPAVTSAEADLTAAPAATQVETGTAPEIGAAPTEGEQTEQEEVIPAPADPAQETQQPPERPIKTSFNVGIGVDVRQVPKEMIWGIDHDMQYMQQNQTGIRRIVSSIYQRGLLGFRGRAQRLRFLVLAETGLKHLPNELMDLTIQQGREDRQSRGRFKRWIVYPARNLVSNVTGLILHTDQKLGLDWIRNQVQDPDHAHQQRSINQIQNTRLRELMTESINEKEAFGSRVALENEEFALREGERRELLQDRQLQDRVMGDFFMLMRNYLNTAPSEASDAEARALIEQYCRESVTINGTTFSLRDVLGDRYRAFESRLSLIGSNMREIAAELRDFTPDYKRAGILPTTDEVTPEAWLNAYHSNDPDKKLNFNIFVAEADISEGAIPLRERIRERVMGRGPMLSRRVVAQGYGSFAYALAAIGVNEVTASIAGGYLGSLATEALNPGKLVKYASAPLLVGATIATLPVSLPVVFASTAAAGILAGAKEIIRLRGERLSIEREASFTMLPDSVTIQRSWVGRALRFAVGGTDRQELMNHIANQREASVLAAGMIEVPAGGVGLFGREKIIGANGTTVDGPNFDINQPLPENAVQNITVNDANRILRALAETRARVRATASTNRRFIRYSSQLNEAQQQVILDGASQEVYERLSFVISQRPDLQNALFNPAEGIQTFRQLYNTLTDAYQYNLVGDYESVRSLDQLQGLLQRVGATESTGDGNESRLGLVPQEQSLDARNNVYNQFAAGKGLHRCAAVAVDGLLAGQAWAEIRHHVPTVQSWMGLNQSNYTPPSAIGALLGEGQQITPDLLPNATVPPIQYADLKLRLPDTFTYDPATHIITSPDGSQQLDLDNVGQNASGHINQADFAIKLKDLGIEMKTGPTPVPLSETHQINIQETTVILPKGVEFVYADPANHVVDAIKLPDGSIHQITDLDITNPADLPKLQTELSNLGFGTDPIEHTTITSGVDKLALASSVSAEQFMGAEGVHASKFMDVEKTFRSYDTAVSDHNELQFYTLRDPDNPRVLILDYSTMKEGYQTGLDPYSLNAQDEINAEKADIIGDEKEELGFFFTVPGQPNKGLFLTDLMDGNVDGQIRFDPDSTKILTFQDGSTMTMGQLSRLLVDQDTLANSSAYDHTIENVSTGVSTKYQDVHTETNNQSIFRTAPNGRPSFIHAGEFKVVNGKKIFESWATIKRTGLCTTGEITALIDQPVEIPAYKLTVTSQLTTDLTFKGDSRRSEFAMGVVPLPYVTYAETAVQKRGTAPGVYKRLSPAMGETREGQHRFMVPLDNLLGINRNNLSPELRSQYLGNVEPAYIKLEQAIQRGSELEIANAREEFLVALQQFNKNGSGAFGSNKPLARNPQEITTEADRRIAFENFRIQLETEVSSSTDQQVADKYFRGDLARAQQVKNNPQILQQFIVDQALKDVSIRELVDERMREMYNQRLTWLNPSTATTDPEIARNEEIAAMNISDDDKRKYDKLESLWQYIQRETKDLEGQEKVRKERMILSRETPTIITDYPNYVTIRKNLDKRIRTRVKTSVNGGPLMGKMMTLIPEARRWGVNPTPTPPPTLGQQP